MKRLSVLIMIALLVPTLVHANETSILYYNNRIELGGTQITKGYYIKESLKRVDPKNPKLLQVQTHTKVTAPEGVVRYRITFQINCETQQFTRIKYWSSGFGEDNGFMVDGVWRDFSDFDDVQPLANVICPKK